MNRGAQHVCGGDPYLIPHGAGLVAVRHGTAQLVVAVPHCHVGVDVGEEVCQGGRGEEWQGQWGRRQGHDAVELPVGRFWGARARFWPWRHQI